MYSNDDEYRAQLLKYFKLNDYNNDVVMQKVELIQEKVKDIPEIREKALEAGSRLNSTDFELCLVLLFSYDHFHEFSKLLEKYNISV
jgi:hypothetical protein